MARIAIDRTRTQPANDVIRWLDEKLIRLVRDNLNDGLFLRY